MIAGDRVVAFFERAVTRERVRAYQGMLAAVFALIAVANFAGGKGLLDASGNVIGADFLAFYTGGRLLAEDRLASAYEAGEDFSFPAQRALQESLLAPQRLPGVHPFVNPPHAALFYAPFAALDYRTAVAAWIAAGLGLLALAVHRFRGAFEALSRWRFARVFGVCFLFVPTMAWLGYGQISSLTLWLYAEAYLSLRRGRDATAGLWLGCLAYKPQLAIALGVALLVAGRWRAVVAGGACASLWLGVGVAIDPDAMAAYLELSPRLPGMIRAPGYDVFGLHSLLGFTALLLDPTSPEWAEGIAAAAALAALGGLAWSWRRAAWIPGSEGWDLRMAATIALGLVVSPHLYLYDLMLLLLPFGILYAHRAAPGPRAVLGGGRVLAWTVLLWAACSLGTQLSWAQVEASEAIGAGPRAIQLSVLAVLGAAWALFREADAADRRR